MPTLRPCDLQVVRTVSIDALGKSQTLVKYLAGTAGDEVSINNGKVFVNFTYAGSLLNNSGLTPICGEEERVKIPEGCIFVAGTRKDSLDSRYKEFGFVKVSDIKGKAIPLGKNTGQLSSFQNYNEPRLIRTSAIVEQNVDEELEAKEQQHKQEDEAFIEMLPPAQIERYKRDKQEKEKSMSRTEIVNYDWARWREDWIQKRKEKNDKIIENAMRHIAANSGVDDEVTRSAKSFVNAQEEKKQLEQKWTNTQKSKKKIKHTQSNTLTVTRNAIDDFVKIALKRHPNWTLNQAKEFFFTADQNDPEFRKIMQEMQRQK